MLDFRDGLRENDADAKTAVEEINARARGD